MHKIWSLLLRTYTVNNALIFQALWNIREVIEKLFFGRKINFLASHCPLRWKRIFTKPNCASTRQPIHIPRNLYIVKMVRWIIRNYGVFRDKHHFKHLVYPWMKIEFPQDYWASSRHPVYNLKYDLAIKKMWEKFWEPSIIFYLLFEPLKKN